MPVRIQLTGIIIGTRGMINIGASRNLSFVERPPLISGVSVCKKKMSPYYKSAITRTIHGNSRAMLTFEKSVAIFKKLVKTPNGRIRNEDGENC